MAADDLYTVLGVGRSALGGDIKKAYRRLARKYHPDINPGDRSAEEHFKRISEAYEILGDPRKREYYDQYGYYSDDVAEKQPEPRWGFSFNGFDFSGKGKSPFEEIFSEFFTSKVPKREPERGSDLEYPVSVSFEESVRGIRARVSVFRKERCETCTGAGRLPESVESACSSCSGTGQVSRSKGRLRFSSACAECAGTGRVAARCGRCGGEGRLPQNERVGADIPAGVTTGSRIRVPGKGDAGRFGGARGDLWIVTNVASHPFFKRVGDNIYCTVPITVTEAALGTKLEVPTIDGRAIVRIPPGTQSGLTFRLRGKGAPSLRNAEVRADQYVEVKIVVPRVGDERSKEILRELAKLNPDNPRSGLFGYGEQAKR